jgi:hypothetical protein
MEQIVEDGINEEDSEVALLEVRRLFLDDADFGVQSFIAEI